MSGDDVTRSDKAHVWHPFTDMAKWCDPAHQPLVIERAEGVYLFDREGKRYLDGNASIWTNIHGHNHPHINAAITAQLEKIAHCSFLGTANEPAARLAGRLVGLFPPDTLTRVFFSDDGSTAMECAMKMALQFWQLEGHPERCEFAAFDRAYHGDTFGATALGGIATFHARFEKLGLRVHRLNSIADLVQLDSSKLAGIAIEPLIQGAAGMRTWREGMLGELRAWCDREDVLLILDEVMTGFGRTGKMFACDHEGVVPDFIALAKGLSGGYLPLAATLTNQRVFQAFDGNPFYYGHSYSGNPLGCAAALANLELFEIEQTLQALPGKIRRLRAELESLEGVGEIRQCGMIAGIDLPGGDGRLGAEVCSRARQLGLLTRPILDTIVLMPPLSISEGQIGEMVAMLGQAIARTPNSA
ncbi:MAG: adenosylmethionine--8-amino-7-oxononanoate transaminase [Verrucomicrobiales bacterium]